MHYAHRISTLGAMLTESKKALAWLDLHRSFTPGQVFTWPPV